MRVFTAEERRQRLAVRHRLAVTATTPAEAADAVVALHATDPATVFLSARARTGCDAGAVEKALYDERSVLRMLGMRRTMFVVTTEVAAEVQAACTVAIAATQRRKYEGFIADSGLGDGAWVRSVEDATAAALRVRGEATGAELSTDVPLLRSQVTRFEGKAYGGSSNITSWVLFLLAADGRIVRGRPRGSWLSTQWRWSPIESWLPEGLPDVAVPQARAALARRWLASYGPATVADLKWWTGWTLGHTRTALKDIGAAEVSLDGVPGVALPSDLEPVAAPEPWVALLPALDPTPMGWQERSWYLGAHGPRLFDRFGNVGPTIWCDGRIVGGWAQRSDGSVAHSLLEDVGAEAASAVGREVAALEAWLTGSVVVPRFRTPLERELST
jgi:hypothetical protein